MLVVKLVKVMNTTPNCKICGQEMARLLNGYVFCLGCKLKKHNDKFGYNKEEDKPKEHKPNKKKGKK